MRRTITELRAGREEMKLKIKRNLNIYQFLSSSYGINNLHHEPRKKLLKHLNQKHKINFNKTVRLSHIKKITSEIAKDKKLSLKTAPAFLRTRRELSFWEIFENLTDKKFYHSYVMGDHVLDGLIPSYTYTSIEDEKRLDRRLECYGTIIEVDGIVHQMSEEKIKKDKEKEEIARQLGLNFIRINNWDIYSDSTKSIIEHIKSSSLYSNAKKILFKRIDLYTLASCAEDEDFETLFGVSKKKLLEVDYRSVLRASKTAKAHEFELPKIIN